MNLPSSGRDDVRRTNADDVFGVLRDEIVSLDLIPGTKLSEADLARRFGVSRQPVREALIRLNHQRLVLVRPQQATVVCKISAKDILHSRFVRIAVEVEVARLACRNVTDRDLNALQHNLDKQEKAVEATDYRRFHTLDYRFHRLLCIAARAELIYRTVAESKQYVERICLLELAIPERFATTYQDHKAIFAALVERNSCEMEALLRVHLARLNGTLQSVRAQNPEFFDD
ncbi:GntR family transcriptional regulator [Pseudoruegeria sp. SK021]|uniref:GntR family transcriptional regulator n=1 Tax=Pseudoruegeria sp. SK021 TaxID=1933035 RepID=UPI000A2218F7|nr:GntR family transcriptional regulator [Pseudoruegeria sp. SK021]OSP55316.1 hypothetical protein BV911_07720 [Pseudoruegeria sp. SK021]